MQHANGVLWGPSGYSAVSSVLHIGGPRLGCGSRGANGKQLLYRSGI